MTDDPFSSLAPSRPLWLITLADLALLLLGFVVLIQATQNVDRHALARGFRAGFGDTAPRDGAVPVQANAVVFAPGSAELPADTDLAGWTRDALRDPRIAVTVTGSSDGTAADVDPQTGSAAVLAADRARALAAALAGIVPAGRLTVTTAPGGRVRTATLTIAFAGEHP